MTGNAKETDGVDRRTALRLMAATLACTTTACERPADTIVPYVRMPERVTPGQPLYFATALGVGGYAAPVLVKSDTGRPIKVEGNPDHPACRGATDAFAQCEILALYDPGRSRAVQRRGQITGWGKLQAELTAHRERWSATQGEGLRLLTGATTSPFLAARISSLLARFPKARWHRWEPLNADNTRAGCELAFGERLEPLLHLDKARVVVALDDDLIGPGPRQVRHALALTSGRRPRAGAARLTRLYAVEPVPSLTGAAADHRLPLRRSRVMALAVALARACGAELPATAEHGDDPLDKAAHAFVAAVADDLKHSAGAALVTVGDAQPPEVHALGYWINEHLGALGQTIELMRPIEADAVDHVSSLSELSRDMAAGAVDTLAILDSNPVYTAPSDLGFSEALARVPLSLRLGLYDDETSALTTWHIPAVHALEAWGDRAATDGAISLVQPLIAPLYGGMTSHDVLDALDGTSGEPGGSYQALQAFWRKRSNTADFDAWWHRTLDSGVVDGTASVSVPPPREARLPAIPAQAQPVQHEVVFLADPSVLDGSYAENAWAQETPRPMTKLVWGNAAHISPSDAKWLSISDGDIVRLRAAGRSIEIPVVIAAGTADGSIGLHVGYGRRTGVIAKGVGTDVYPLRTSKALWTVGATIMAAGRRSELLTTQAQTRIEGRDLLRTTALSKVASAALRTADGAPPASLYPEHPATVSPYQWAMVIDLTACIGCNACVVACQAENNVPVVGPTEIARGRDMHWLRVDAYIAGSRIGFQPVPCMHCEKAPCEPMCPVEAAVHDSDGLNVQVYNRCIGTRFCQANCPYKVRRFNFFGYADGQEYANLGSAMLAAAKNPDVSVRARGVMEKCTYCVQRISAARREAEGENRLIRDGEVVPACAQACPTRAIAFGNKTDPQSVVSQLRRQPHEYALLGELGTRPRTTYLAQVRDRNDTLEESR